MHQRRELLYDDNEILDKLTGHNRFDKHSPNDPHPTWTEVKKATICEARPKGIKGSTKLIRQCKCPCMKKMKASVCSCDICEEFKDALHRFNRYQKVWHNQAKEKRKCELIRNRQEENASEEEIHQFLQSLENNDDQLMCNKCSGNCHPGKAYKTFSESPSTCRAALLCKQIHIPPLDLPVLDKNFRLVPGEIDFFKIEPEACCYGHHVGLETSSTQTTKSYPKCGWDGKFRHMPLHEWSEEDPKTKDIVSHSINACPIDINREGKIIWMKFQKVARAMEKPISDKDDDYGVGNSVKFQTEWLPVEGTVHQFFIHLRASIAAYLPHAYEVKLSGRADKCAERAFIIDPVVRENCPDQYKKYFCEVFDFSSSIQTKMEHKITCSFLENINANSITYI